MITIDFRKLTLRPGDRVMDAGCGEGRHVFACYRLPCRIIGLDLNPESLRKAKFVLDQMARQKEGQGEVLLLRADTLRFPFRDGSFDKIICCEVVEHVADERLAIRELSRILRIGGQIAISVPSLFTENLYDYLSPEYFRTPGGHIRKVQPQHLAKIMEGYGLLLYRVGFAHAFHSPYWALRCLFGLHDEYALLPSLYRRFLRLALFSRPLRRLEGICNYFFPKSIVLYAQKQSTVHRPQSTAS